MRGQNAVSRQSNHTRVALSVRAFCIGSQAALDLQGGEMWRLWEVRYKCITWLKRSHCLNRADRCEPASSGVQRAGAQVLEKKKENVWHFTASNPSIVL